MNITDTLKDIAGTYLPAEDQEPRFPRCKAGPNRWDEITPDDYGHLFDYRIIRRGGMTVIDPCSEAALQWCYRFLPADCPRWGSVGHVVETKYASEILEAMAQVKLLSEDDYIYSQSCEDRDRHQGENRG